MNRVTANAVYYFDPCMMDKIHGNSTELFKLGDKVRVINLPGCPKANTMGQCYIIAADAKKDSRGNYKAPFAMVSVQSLEKEKPDMYPTIAKDAPIGSYLLVESRTDTLPTAFVKEDGEKYVRLWDAAYYNAIADHKCRIVTREEAVAAAIAYRKATA